MLRKGTGIKLHPVPWLVLGISTRVSTNTTSHTIMVTHGNPGRKTAIAAATAAAAATTTTITTSMASPLLLILFLLMLVSLLPMGGRWFITLGRGISIL